MGKVRILCDEHLAESTTLEREVWGKEGGFIIDSFSL